MQGITILGSTGSIGCQTLQVLEDLKDSYQVKALVAGSNYKLLFEQVKRFSPSLVVLVNESYMNEINYLLKDYSTKVLIGEEGLLEAVTLPDVHLILNAMVGAKGLKPTLAAIRAGKDIALANKETLVSGGSLVMPLLKEKKVKLLPVDSEHSAIFQALSGQRDQPLRRIILTASGGPFLGLTKEELEQVTPQDALKHPTWKMGGKITIDSATMMNKGLEVIEAHWLFDLDYDRIEVIIHPQSIVHSLVEFEDTSMMAQLGLPDMRSPIQYALTYPKRVKSQLKSLDLSKVGSLDFRAPDLDLFPCLPLAYHAGREGGSAPIVLNAANEVLVEKFLSQEIPFPMIPQILEKILNLHVSVIPQDEEEIYYWDDWARQKVMEKLGGVR